MKTYGKKQERDVLLRKVPVDVLEWVKTFAETDHRSMNAQIIHVLSEYVEQRHKAEER